MMKNTEAAVMERQQGGNKNLELFVNCTSFTFIVNWLFLFLSVRVETLPSYYQSRPFSRRHTFV